MRNSTSSRWGTGNMEWCLGRKRKMSGHLFFPLSHSVLIRTSTRTRTRSCTHIFHEIASENSRSRIPARQIGKVGRDQK